MCVSQTASCHIRFNLSHSLAMRRCSFVPITYTQAVLMLCSTYTIWGVAYEYMHAVISVLNRILILFMRLCILCLFWGMSVSVRAVNAKGLQAKWPLQIFKHERKAIRPDIFEGALDEKLNSCASATLLYVCGTNDST